MQHHKFITFTHHDGVGAVEGRYGRLLEPHLKYTRYLFGAVSTTTPKLGVECLGRYVGDRFEFPAKLWMRLFLVVNEEGYLLAPERSIRCPHPDAKQLARSSGAVRTLFRSPSLRGGAVIRTSNKTDRSGLVIDLLRVFPGCRIAFAVKNRTLESQWHRRITRAGVPQRVYSSQELARSFWGRNPKVLVTSFAKLDHCRKEDFDLVVVPEPGPLLNCDRWLFDPAPGRDYRLPRDPDVPAFGLLAEGVRLSRSEELRLGSFFGQIVHVGSGQQSPVKVRIETIRHALLGTAPHPAVDVLSHKRQIIWFCGARNSHIARVASRYSEPGRRTLLLVENPEHAHCLAPLMPHWNVRTAAHTNDGEPTRDAIVTETWLAKQARIDADVLIDARGWGPVSLPSTDTTAKPLTIVDIADRAPMAAKRRSRLRRSEYSRRGWI